MRPQFPNPIPHFSIALSQELGDVDSDRASLGGLRPCAAGDAPSLPFGTRPAHRSLASNCRSGSGRPHTAGMRQNVRRIYQGG